MTRRRKITLLVLAGLAFVVVAFWLLRPREPEYQGRPLSAWLEQLTATRDGVEHEQAVAAVRAIGTNAVPVLVDMAAYRAPKWRVALEDFLRRKGLSVKMARRERYDVARAGFTALGSDARSAIPRLQSQFIYGDSKSWVVAFQCLHGIGPASIPAFVAGLSSTNVNARRAAAMGLGSFRSASGNAVPSLINALNANATDANELVDLLRALHAIGKTPETSVPAIAPFLNHTNSKVRYQAVILLGKYGPYFESARAALEMAVKDPDSGVKQAAEKALQQLKSAR